jgi:hypothetical protein
MRKAMRIAAVTVLLLGTAVSAHADYGFGNPEETALRPYKGLWRGVKAFTYNIVKSLDVGNRKFPGLGVVELGRGTRYGAVELAYSTYMGMAGSRPKPVKAYSWPNEYIDSDWLLRNSADLAGGAIFWGHGTSFSTKAPAAIGTFTAQKVVDHSPVLSERERALYLEEKPQYAAQRDYLGKRAVKPREDGRIDFISRARRQHTVAPPMIPSTMGNRPVLTPPPGITPSPGVMPGGEIPEAVPPTPPVAISPAPPSIPSTGQPEIAPMPSEEVTPYPSGQPEVAAPVPTVVR